SAQNTGDAAGPSHPVAPAPNPAPPARAGKGKGRAHTPPAEDVVMEPAKVPPPPDPSRARLAKGRPVRDPAPPKPATGAYAPPAVAALQPPPIRHGTKPGGPSPLYALAARRGASVKQPVASSSKRRSPSPPSFASMDPWS